MESGFYNVKIKGETLFKRQIKSENLVDVCLKTFIITTAQEMPVYIISKLVYRVKILNEILKNILKSETVIPRPVLGPQERLRV